MVMLDVFRQDPFSAIQLTTAVEKVPFLPSALGDLGIFEDDPIRTKALAVEERAGQLTLIPTSPRGAPMSERTSERRKMRYFDVPRIVQGDTITADELQGIREFGTESVLMQVQTEVARRLSGPTGITRNVEYTWENMRLGAIQGLLLDADGSTIYNWFDEFGIVEADEIPFNLAAQAEGTLRPICNGIVRSMARSSKGAFLPTTQVYGLCGDEFWDQLTNHPDVTRTYYNWSAAAELRQGQAFEAMRYGGIDWFNYRGSDDTSTIAIPTDEVKFFPVGAPGIFKRALAPAETFDFVNTPGKPMYIIPIFDRDRNSWWRAEVYSYPLHICTRPEVLRRGRAGA